MQSNAMNANSNMIHSSRERLWSSTAIILQKHRAREEPSKLRGADYVERNDHGKCDGEVRSMKVMGVNLRVQYENSMRCDIGDEPCQQHRSTSTKSVRRGVASVQAVHWVCQLDASSRELQTHAKPLPCQVTKVTMSC